MHACRYVLLNGAFWFWCDFGFGEEVFISLFFPVKFKRSLFSHVSVMGK